MVPPVREKGEIAGLRVLDAGDAHDLDVSIVGVLETTPEAIGQISQLHKRPAFRRPAPRNGGTPEALHM